MGFGTRKPTSNDLPTKTWQYGANELYDDVAILLNSLGARCQGCKRVTWNKYLEDGKCPECREEA